MPARRLTTTAAAGAAALLAGATLLGGCSGHPTSTTASAGAADRSAPKAERQLPQDAVSAGSSSGADEGEGARNTSARVLPVGRDIVYRGQITVRVKDVAAAAARAETLAAGVDGLVFAEETETGPGQSSAARASLTLRVPPTQFRPLLDQLGRLGKQLSRSQTAEDVTTQVVDVESRLQSQKRSVARMQTLLGRATTIGEIVQVEGELARREADLESLEAQQKKLDDITELATIDLSLVAPDTPAPTPADDEDLGFLAGLRGGWNAFLAVVVVALTGIGALVPFVILLGLVGVPAWLVVRSRRHPSAAAPTSTPTPPLPG
jgi:hypothetical protein